MRVGLRKTGSSLFAQKILLASNNACKTSDNWHWGMCKRRYVLRHLMLCGGVYCGASSEGTCEPFKAWAEHTSGIVWIRHEKGTRSLSRETSLHRIKSFCHYRKLLRRQVGIRIMHHVPWRLYLGTRGHYSSSCTLGTPSTVGENSNDKYLELRTTLSRI